MAAEHTPTPWQAIQCGIYPLLPLSKPGDPRNDLVAATGDEGDEMAGQEQLANARFIVRACNRDHVFEELVATLGNIFACADGIMPASQSTENLRATILRLDDARWTRLFAIREEARAALAKAKGEQ